MTILRKCAAAAIASTMALSAASAGAAEVRLATVSGDVRVNQGEGFLAAEAGAVLNVGDRVLTGDDATAVIAYEACAIEVPAASLATVASPEICTAPAQYTQENGETQINPALIAGGVIVVGGIIVGIASAGGGGGGGAPISP